MTKWGGGENTLETKYLDCFSLKIPFAMKGHKWDPRWWPHDG